MSIDVLVNAGPWLPVPPEGYGGIETVVATLIPPLRELGARVTLATVGAPTVEVDDVITPLDEPKFASIARPYNQVSGIAHAHMQGVVAAIRERQFDIVHDHLEVVGIAVLAAMGEACPPVLQTLHWDMRKHADFYSRFDGAGRVGFAAVSQSQLDRAPDAIQRQAVGVVPLAVPAPEPMDVPRGDHALVLARITRDKGQDMAARACVAAGVPLILAGPVAGIGDVDELHERIDGGDADLLAHPDVSFYVESVRPLLDGDLVRWVGGVAGERKERLLRGARALMTPNRWAEPGATGVVEALTRGIPVIGTPLGVLPSLVEHDRTGFLVDDEQAMAQALAEVDRISPADCIAAAAQWTPQRMAEQYLELYDEMIRRTR